MLDMGSAWVNYTNSTNLGLHRNKPKSIQPETLEAIQNSTPSTGIRALHIVRDTQKQ